MLVGVAIAGYLLLTYKRPTPSPSSPLPVPSTPTSVSPLMDAKYNLDDCSGPDAPTGVAAFKAGKATCIKEGNRNGIIFQFTNGNRCTVKCTGGTLDLLTAADKKKLGIDKCKCDGVRADLEAEMKKTSSYARAYKVYSYRRLN
jgi:hypothetical protein